MLDITITSKVATPEVVQQQFPWFIKRWGKVDTDVQELYKPYYQVSSVGCYMYGEKEIREETLYLCDALDFDTVKVVGDMVPLEAVQVFPGKVIKPRYDDEKAISQVKDALMRAGFYKHKQYPKVTILNCDLIYRPLYLFMATFLWKKREMQAYGDALGQGKVSRRM